MPATRLRRAAALVAVATLPLTGLAACGGDGDEEDEDQEQDDGLLPGGEEGEDEDD